MKKAALSEFKDDLSKFLRLAEKDDILIPRYGKPTGVLIGFEDEEDWFAYRVENNPRFLNRIKQSRKSLKSCLGLKVENI